MSMRRAGKHGSDEMRRYNLRLVIVPPVFYPLEGRMFTTVAYRSMPHSYRSTRLRVEFGE